MRALIIVVVIVAMALPAFAALPVGLEPEFDRHRMQVGFGGGYGKVSVGDAGVFAETSSTPDDFTVGMALDIEYAYRLTPEVSVGAFISTWMGALDGELGNEDWVTGVFGGAFQYRPGGKGLYLKAGFGACSVYASVDDPGEEEPLEDYTDYGFGVVGAVGYDVTISQNFAAGPRLAIQAMDVGDGVTALSSSLLFMFTF